MMGGGAEARGADRHFFDRQLLDRRQIMVESDHHGAGNAYFVSLLHEEKNKDFFPGENSKHHDDGKSAVITLTLNGVRADPDRGSKRSVRQLFAGRYSPITEE